MMYGVQHAPLTLGTNTASGLTLTSQELSLNDVFVQLAGDTMTGALVIDGSADTNQLRIQGNGTQTNNILLIENSGGTDLMWVDNNGRVTTVASASGGFAVDGLVINHTGSLATITNSTGSLSIEGVATNEIVINNLAADVNFRVEADNNQNILMVDAGINNATGGVGIGTNAQNDNRLYVSWANDQDINLKGISIDVSQTVAFTKTLRGMNVTANFSGTTGTMTGVNALEFDVRASGNGGTISTAQGVSANANVSTGATITNLYLMRLFNATNSGTIGTVEALRIEDQTQFGASTSNAIHTFGGGVIFNDNGRDSDFRIEGDTEANLFFLDASVDAIGVGISTPGARLHIDQSSTTAAKPVLTVDQADVSEEFIRFIGSSANTVLTQSIVEAADVGTATVAGYLKVFVQDDGNQLTDQAYFLAIYTLA